MTASKIEIYEIRVNEVLPSKGIHKVNYTTNFLSMKVNPSFTEMTLNLTSDKPRLYCLTLEVKDVADNIRQCRRFILVDETTSIETKPDQPFTFTSASPDTGYTWQTHHDEICLAWKDYFVNKFYFDNELFNGVEADPHGLITGMYEQISGELPVSGTPNVHGIVKYMVSWQFNERLFTQEIEVPDFQNQTFCQMLPVIDGDKYKVIVRPVDIVGNTYKASRTVFIDKSAPIVNELCIHNTTQKDQCITWMSDTDRLFLTFEGYDNHSGILHMEWFFGMLVDSKAVKISNGELKMVNIQFQMFVQKLLRNLKNLSHLIPIT